MGDCERLSACAFFKKYQADIGKELALKGFIRLFCQGKKQNECIRKKVSGMLGGPDKVPINMLPNGMPMKGTDYAEWPIEVLKIVRGNM